MDISLYGESQFLTECNISLNVFHITSLWILFLDTLLSLIKNNIKHDPYDSTGIECVPLRGYSTGFETDSRLNIFHTVIILYLRFHNTARHLCALLSVIIQVLLIRWLPMYKL